MRPPGADVNGKIAEALAITQRFPEEIEADLQRYYGLNYVNLFVPKSGLTWRKLLVLLRHLPPESALNTAIRNEASERDMAVRDASADPAKGKWSSIEMLLASLIDEARYGNWAYVQVHSEKSVPRPSPVPRPGVNKRQGKVMTLDEARKIDPRLRNLSAEEAQKILDGVIGHR